MRFECDAARWRYLWLESISTLLLLILSTAPANAQTVIATIPVGQNPWDVAVNPVTDKIYVTNMGSGTVTVINGHNNKTTTISAPSLYLCAGVAVNPVTNKIYVASEGSSTMGFGDGDITLIDGATNATMRIKDPQGFVPGNVVVNPESNKIYVMNYGSAGPYYLFFTPSVTVIDGATNSVTNLPGMANGFPEFSDLVVNSVTNKVYAGSLNGIEVIDGATNSVTTIPGAMGDVLAMNPVTNKLYAGMTNGGDIQVIDAATKTVTTEIPASNFSEAVANSVTNRIYLTHTFPDVIPAGYVEAVDGATNATTIIQVPNAAGPDAIALNSKTDKVYVGNLHSNNVTVINGDTNTTTTVSDPNTYQPWAVAVNPVTDRIYVVNRLSNNVTVISDRRHSHGSGKP